MSRPFCATEIVAVSSDTTITQTGDGKLTWESFNRTINGTLQPSLDKIEITRAKGD